MITNKGLKEIISEYPELRHGLSGITEVAEGRMSNNFIIESGGEKYFLKRHRFLKRRPIDDSQAVERFFFLHGIPVVLPLRTKSGKIVLKREGRFFSLFPFVSGSHFSDDKTPSLAAASLGQTLGRIHKAGERGYPRIRDKFKPWDKESFHREADAILKIIDAKRNKSKFDKKIARTIRFKRSCVDKEYLRYEDMKNLRVGLIHGDYHDGNVFFDKKGVVKHVFDFEKTGIAPFTFEVIRAIQYSHVTGYGKEKALGAVKRFLRGYTKERPLRNGELRDGMEIFYQKQIHSLWVEKEHYLYGNARVDNLLHSVSYLRRIGRSRTSLPY
ncbi:MAG: phosphotransferase [Candidatus Pacebacteria bacterium]|nr:phosphotransferase [Candidatus Paceibacterota bacterium]